MGAAALLNPQILMPLAGLSLSIPFLGRQQQGEDNIYGGINFGTSPSISNPFDFQKLLNIGKKDKFTENFLNEGINDTSGTILKSDLVENKPTEFLGGEVAPSTEFSSTTSSNNNNNNNNNNKKDENNIAKTIGSGVLFGTAFDLAGRLSNKIGNIFSKKDDKDEDNGKSDFEDITGITYEKAMEMQRKRENELMNKRALMGGIKDAGQYAYLGGQAQMEAAKNIGLNTQDMLRSMAYGQAALANTIAGASKTVPLARTYFS